MLTKRNFIEVFESIKQHKTRNYLTGFGVAWGIFILLVMLGAGEAFRVGVGSQFGGFAENSITFFGGQTSKVKMGEPAGRKILFTKPQVDKIRVRFQKDVNNISPVIFYSGDKNIHYDKNFSSSEIIGVLDDFFRIKTFDLVEGRILNALDIHEKRKVTVITETIRDEVFDGINPVGKYINLTGDWYQVVGVVKSDSMLNQGYQRSVFMPYDTMVKYLHEGEEIWCLLVGLSDTANALDTEKVLLNFFSKELRFDTNDRKSVSIMNLNQQRKSFDGLFSAIKIIVWFFGICILVTAMIGVSNIMLVIVKERTKEIGIRKALGAKSKDILNLVVLESISITVIAGLIGIITSFGMLAIINFVIGNIYNNQDLVKQLSFNPYTAVVTFIILVLSGTIAGYFPALKATKVSPVNAIRYE